jgi:hypothetical protein
VQELAKRVLPLCENYIVVSQFTEARSHFKHGLVNHAFAAALRAILQVFLIPCYLWHLSLKMHSVTMLKSLTSCAGCVILWVGFLSGLFWNILIKDSCHAL